jgi:fibronectin type 3 domain-containing protein
VLSWTASTATTVVGYRVYYGNTTGTYIQAFGSGIAAGYATSYSISGLTKGKTYYFAVTAVDAVGNESGFSNEAVKVVQ